jgi:DNA-binding HxlR family transcriptional regulator
MASSEVDSAVRLTGPLDPRGGWTASMCSIGRALEAVSTRSAILILREAFYGTTRFEDFAQRAGISEPVAAQRLHELVDEGILDRAPYQEPGKRTRLQYRLTEKGADLFPALVALMQWGDRWMSPAGAPVVLRHRGCGEPARAEVRCAGGHTPAIGDLDLAVGPAIHAAKQARPPSTANDLLPGTESS